MEIAQLCAVLELLQEPIEIEWFLEAEKGGEKLLRSLLSYHLDELRELFFYKVYDGAREDSLCFFGAMMDQLLPNETLPLVPLNAVTEDSSLFFSQLRQWGRNVDPGLLRPQDASKTGKEKKCIFFMVFSIFLLLFWFAEVGFAFRSSYWWIFCSV